MSRECNGNSGQRGACVELTEKVILCSETKVISQMAMDGLRDYSPITGTDPFLTRFRYQRLTADDGRLCKTKN